MKFIQTSESFHPWKWVLTHSRASMKFIRNHSVFHTTIRCRHIHTSNGACSHPQRSTTWDCWGFIMEWDCGGSLSRRRLLWFNGCYTPGGLWLKQTWKHTQVCENARRLVRNDRRSTRVCGGWWWSRYEIRYVWTWTWYEMTVLRVRN